MNLGDFVNNYGSKQPAPGDALSSQASATTGGFNVSYGQTPEQMSANNQLLVVGGLLVGLACLTGIVAIAAKGKS